ncbi:MAG: hypothetical protein A2Y34_01410 [Spirochaetes bacterium GWC1_27_15]|nr:MAG: hypothetical protein A2Z98_06980 [Spirochaetes bacterium GWB1_27_13]OHD21490.1 MAG: hypothetical protein A2Y34_01410 [Spirochaetes bacterium GWC1_27_15]
MKFRINPFLCFFILFILFSCKNTKKEETKTESKQITATIKFESVRVRKLPDIKGDIITKVAKGETVTILRKTDNKEKVADYDEDYWYEVQTKENLSGWVFGALIDINFENISKDKTNIANNFSINWKNNNYSFIIKKPIILGEKLFLISKNNIFYSIDIKTGKTIWKQKINDDITFLPIIGIDFAYILSNTNLYAFDLKNGVKKWEFKLDQVIKIEPVIYNSNIILVDSQNFIYSIDSKTGKKINSYKFQSNISYFLPNNENILIVTAENELYSIKM